MTTPAPRLPELTRSLRSFGVLHGTEAERAFEAACAPLVRARSVVERCDDVASVRRSWLESAVGAQASRRVAAVAAESVTGEAERRARQAQAAEVMEPLIAALAAADVAAEAMTDDAAGWEHWVSALRTAFRCADEAVRPLAALLTRPSAPPGGVGWLRRPR